MPRRFDNAIASFPYLPLEVRFRKFPTRAFPTATRGLCKVMTPVSVRCWRMQPVQHDPTEAVRAWQLHAHQAGTTQTS